MNDNKLVKYINKLERKKFIQVLNLSDNQITDTGFQILIQRLKEHVSLEKIILKNNKITS